jgi:peptidoglycan/LPS O-acetylase OafA/YrhL
MSKLPNRGEKGSSISDRAHQHLTFLDQSRGAAIILVLLCHCTLNFNGVLNDGLYDPVKFLGQLLTGKISPSIFFEFLFFYPCRHCGWLAVAAFFVISGFCIHLSYSQSAKPDLTAFYIRRFFRIYPPYFLALLGFAFLFPYSQILFSRWSDWIRLLAHLLLVHNLSVNLGAVSASYWTIAVETQLYLLFPILLLLVRRYSFTKALWIIGTIQFSLQAITAVLFGLYHLPPFLISASPFFYWFSWSIGAALCDAYLKGQPLPFRRVPPWLWFILAMATSGFAAHEFCFPFFALASVSLFARFLEHNALADNNASEEPVSRCGEFLRITGTYSYSIYLIHHPLLIAVTENYKRLFPGIENHPFLMFGAGLSSALIIFPLGGLCYHFLEKPSIQFSKSWLQRRSQRRTQLTSPEMSAAGGVFPG